MLLVFVRVVVATTFGVSAVLKLWAVDEFVSILPRFGVPRSLERQVAWMLIGTEAVIAPAMVSSGVPLTMVLGFAALLLTVFSAALLRVMVLRVSTSCHCFGHSTTHVSWVDLVRNAALLVVVGVGLLLTLPSSFGIGPRASHTLLTARPDQALLAAVGGVLFAVCCSQLARITRLLSLLIHDVHSIVRDEVLL